MLLVSIYACVPSHTPNLTTSKLSPLLPSHPLSQHRHYSLNISGGKVCSGLPPSLPNHADEQLPYRGNSCNSQTKEEGDINSAAIILMATDSATCLHVCYPTMQCD